MILLFWKIISYCILFLCVKFILSIYLLNRYWKDKNVPHKKSSWSPVGNRYPIFALIKPGFYTIMDFYNEFPNERYCGSVELGKPELWIRDLELIKQVLVKDFNYFVNRIPPIAADPIISKNLLNLKDEKWRKMRAILSPSFTGSKMKFLFNLVSDCAIQFTRHFESLDSKIIEIEMKDASRRFAIDVIANSIFGIATDSLNQKDNELFQKGKEADTSGRLQNMLMAIYALFPYTKKILGASIVSVPGQVTFFQRIIKETIESREKNGTVRPDMIQLLLESRSQASLIDQGNLANNEDDAYSPDGAVPKAKVTDDDIVAQAILFFLTGFAAVPTLASFMSYELALNKDVQKKLQAEIDQVTENCDGKLLYDQIVGMKYLDMVVSESMRKWPTCIALGRVCGKDYVIEGRNENEKSIVIEKGVSIIIPIIALHRDPSYFPNPDQFDPERFSDENKSKIVPFSYMPFGMGPRNCVASRFALMETKIFFFHLLSKFDIVPTDKTPIPLILNEDLSPDEGFWLSFQRRN